MLHLLGAIIDYYVFNPIIKDNTRFNELTSAKCGRRISLVIIYPAIPSIKYLIYSHGNRSTIINGFDYWKSISNQAQCNVIIYDYIGYGLSESIRPSEQNCYNSLETVMDYVLITLKVPSSDIILIGRSLGTSIVVNYVAKQNWTYPIMLISPYKSICTVVIDYWPISLIDKFNSDQKISKLRCPVKIIHGMDDDFISIDHSKILYSKLYDKTFDPVWMPNADYYIELLCYKKLNNK